MCGPTLGYADNAGNCSGIAFALKKGNGVETSLMMAYLTFQIYYLTDGPNPWLYLGSLQQSGPPQLVQRYG